MRCHTQAVRTAESGSASSVDETLWALRASEILTLVTERTTLNTST